MKRSARALALFLLAAVLPACGGPPVPGPTPEQIPVPASREYPHAAVRESVFDAGTVTVA
jgi:hypothetical protein